MDGPSPVPAFLLLALYLPELLEDKGQIRSGDTGTRIRDGKLYALIHRWHPFRVQASCPASVTGRLTVTSVPVPTSLSIWISPP